MTLFTPWTKQVNVRPDIFINGVVVPLFKTPKILGVIFDTLFTFGPHIAAIAAKANQRLNILKAVSGSNWGHDKATLLITYKALVELVFSYAAAIWYPNAKLSNVAKLQFVQNSAMRLITDCHKASFIAHLHAETSGYGWHLIALTMRLPLLEC
jgi:hypothetical protein